MTDTRPNILLVLSDQHRWDVLGCENHPDVKTPNFDRLAREGMTFTRAVSNAPVCSPYRASLQTGLYHHQHGIVRNNLYLDPTFTSLADCFNDAGYVTGYIGKAHWWGGDKPGYTPRQARLRWQHFIGHNRGHYQYDTPTFDETGQRRHEHEGTYEPTIQTDWAIQFIEQHHGQRPWLCHLNWGPPHNATMDRWYADPNVRQRLRQMNHDLALNIPDHVMADDKPDDPAMVNWFPQHLVGPLVDRHYLDMYTPSRLTIADHVPEQYHTLIGYCLQEYYAMVSSLDDQLARLLQSIEQLPADRPTYLIYTSDHGDMLGAHGTIRGKSVPRQPAYRVPLICWGTQDIQRGTQTDNLISTIDLMPTLCGLADIHCPENLPGVNMAPHCFGGIGPQPEHVLLGLGNWRAIYDGRYCYAHHIADGQSKPWYLFDTVNDPLETRNLLAEAEYASLQQQLCSTLFQHLAAVCDGHWLSATDHSRWHGH